MNPAIVPGKGWFLDSVGSDNCDGMYDPDLGTILLMGIILQGPGRVQYQLNKEQYICNCNILGKIATHTMAGTMY
jgi:hypothetical protein